jgi:hypothetical protein
LTTIQRCPVGSVPTVTPANPHLSATLRAQSSTGLLLIGQINTHDRVAVWN